MKGKSAPRSEHGPSSKAANVPEPDADDDDMPEASQEPKKHGGKVRGDRERPRLDKRARGGSVHIKPSHRGLLHKELGVPQGKKIPQAKLEAAKHSSNPAERKRATFAENFGHAKGGKVKLGAARSPFDKD